MPLCIVLAIASCAAIATADPWMYPTTENAVRIAAPSDASDADAQAVTLFRDIWTKCTGRSVADTQMPQDDAVNVWIGAPSVPPEWQSRFDLGQLKRDGIVIETFTDNGQRHLLLAGGPGKGTIYAVYEFFELAFGVRWLAPEVTHIPPTPTAVPELHVRYEPPFEFRDTHLPRGANRDTYRNNSRFLYGTHGHSFFHLLPPDGYFADHPEYYAEIDGERRAPVGLNWKSPVFGGEHPEAATQLCMSNPATAEALARAIAKGIEENPAANVWSVSQMDWSGNCTCATCRAIDEQEGSPAGSLLTGVNRVAELVEADFPNVFIQTYAYTYTRKPPKTIRPRRNVIVQLCTFECDFARTLDDPDSNVNRLFMDDLRGWKALDANILFYDYPINCSFPPIPYPNLHVLAPYMRTFVESGGIGVFEQGIAGRAAAFGYLRPYLISKLMWNPGSDPDAIIDEFLSLYYGEAAPHLREYIDLCRATILQSGMPLYLFDMGAWLTSDHVEQAEAIFQRARDAAESDTVRERVDRAYFQVQLSGFLAKPDVEIAGDILTAAYPVSLTKSELRQRTTDLGMQDEWPGSWPDVDDMMRPLPDVKPGVPLEVPLVRIENERYAVWIAPQLSGSVLRWHDKTTQREWLRGYLTAGVGRGTWQDWIDRNTNGERPAAQEYRVVESTARRLVLEATTDEKVVVQRIMELQPEGQLDVTITATNRSGAPIEGWVKSHPEFYAQHAKITPEIWFRDAQGWTRREAPKPGILAADFIPVELPLEWAFYIPEAQAGIKCTVPECDIDRVLYFYDTSPGIEQINLELLPKRTILEPGQSRTIRASYATIQTSPGADSK